MTTRDRIEEWVRTVLNQIATAADDNDLTELAQIELQRLWADISAALDKFNQPTGPDPMSDGGPTQADIRGEVTHDIG